jgi:hypothetical protein
MGLFGRRKPAPTLSTPDEVVAVVADPVTGRARVGEYAAPIYPLLVDTAYSREALHEELPPEHRPVLRVLECGLSVRYAFDRGGHWDYVTRSVAERIGHDDESLHAEALAWLTQLDFYAEGGGGRLRLEMPEGKEDLAASLVLRAGDLWSQFGDRVEGDLVVAVAQRIAVHLCGSADAESVQGLRELSVALYALVDEAKPVSRELYVISADGALRAL